jgi:hypothetical protein
MDVRVNFEDLLWTVMGMEVVDLMGFLSRFFDGIEIV